MPDHAMMIGGKTAILGRDGTLKVGKTEEIITEKKLEELYQVKPELYIFQKLEERFVW